MNGIAGRTFLITGGARGQGAAAGAAIVGHGGRVVLSDILEAEGSQTAKTLGPSARFVIHDVGDPSGWKRAVEAAEEEGGLHGLVNNAGVLLSKGLRDTTREDWDRVIRINQTGCFLGMREAAPAIERAGGGAIINVSSIAGLHGAPRNFAYAASKWAVRGMTRAAAVDLAPRGIRVNGIYPGSIDTEMLAFWNAEQRAAWLARVPMGRMAAAKEVAAAILFLLSDAGGFVNGAELAIDGGSAAS